MPTLSGYIDAAIAQEVDTQGVHLTQLTLLTDHLSIRRCLSACAVFKVRYSRFCHVLEQGHLARCPNSCYLFSFRVYSIFSSATLMSQYVLFMSDLYASQQ